MKTETSVAVDFWIAAPLDDDVDDLDGGARLHREEVGFSAKGAPRGRSPGAQTWPTALPLPAALGAPKRGEQPAQDQRAELGDEAATDHLVPTIHHRRLPWRNRALRLSKAHLEAVVRLV